jgi:hypothetical protein
MSLHNGENVWKLALGLAIAAFFFCIGIAHAIFPDRFIKRSSVRKGSEMLTDFNRTGFQTVGIITAAFGGFMLYVLVGPSSQTRPKPRSPMLNGGRGW